MGPGSQNLPPQGLLGSRERGAADDSPPTRVPCVHARQKSGDGHRTLFCYETQKKTEAIRLSAPYRGTQRTHGGLFTGHQSEANDGRS